MILREVETCELLKQFPHPNVAQYYGYRETGGRVSGLCFKRYQASLLETVNPQCLNKSDFLRNRWAVCPTLKQSLQGLLAGIKLLHSLGIIHNDITPANFMVGDAGEFILIDFDSCRRLGEPLKAGGIGTKRTYGWHNPNVEEATEANDLDAFAELQTWLFGSSAHEYLFK